MAAPSNLVVLLLCGSALAEPELHKPDPNLKLLSNTVSPVMQPVMENQAPLQEQLTRAIGSFLNLAPSPAEVSAEIQNTLADHAVVVYTYTLSPFSQEAIKVLESTRCIFHTVDLGPQWMLLGPRSSAIRAEIGRKWGVTSMPQIFINGEWVGGLFSGGAHGGGLNQLIEEGRLLSMISAAGAMCMDDSMDDRDGPSWEVPIDDYERPAAGTPTTAEEAGMPIGRHVEVSDDVGSRLAEIVREAAAKAIADRGHFIIAIAGGSLVKMLGAMAEMEDVQWDKWHVAWVDERCVPHDDEDSNYGGAKAAWLDHVPIPKDNIHPIADSPVFRHPVMMRGGLAAESAAADYEQRLRHLSNEVLPRVGPSSFYPSSSLFQQDPVEYDSKVGMPIFDLLLLGFGPDGHVCSLFPKHSLLDEKSQRWVLPVYDSPKPPAERITFSMKAVNSAKEVILIGTGEAKAGVVGAAFTWGGGHKELPCTMIEGDPLWLIDGAAATELPAHLYTAPADEDDAGHCERRARRLEAAVAPADEQAWFAEWRERLECWWVATPYQAGLGACMSALSLALAQRFQGALGGSRAAQPGDAAPAEAGCEWIEKGEALQLPDFPDLGNFEFTVPPVPRLVPSWERLQALTAPQQRQHLTASQPTSTTSTYMTAAGAGFGFAAGVAGFALVLRLATRRGDQGLTSRVQIRRGESESGKK